MVWLHKHGRLDWSEGTPNTFHKIAAMTQTSEAALSDGYTYLSTQEGDTYLSLITDEYSQKTVRYHLDDNMKTSSMKKSLVPALKVS